MDAIQAPIWILALAIVGLGPSCWVCRSLKSPALVVPAAVPLGHALTLLLAFPLYRFVGPVKAWALPAFVVLALASGILCILSWRWLAQCLRPRYISGNAWWMAGLGVLALALALPSLRGGLQYAAFRSNPSDAFVYMTEAETVRTTSRALLAAGAPFHPGNMDAVLELGRACPSALFSARFTQHAAQLNYTGAFAWASELCRIPVHRMFQPYGLTCCLALYGGVFCLMLIAGAGPMLASLAGAAAAGGYWSRWVIELDSHGQLAGIPLLVLAVALWAGTEEARGGLWSTGRIALGIVCASLATAYAPLVLPLAAAMVCFHGGQLIGSPSRRDRFWLHGATFLFAVAALAFTLQADNAVAIMRHALFQGATVLPGSVAPDGELLALDPLATVWGFPRRALLPSIENPWLRRLGSWSALAAGLACCIGVVVFAIRATRKGAGVERMLLVLCACGLGIALVSVVTNSPRSAIKSFTFTQPFLVVALALGLSALRLPLRGRWAEASTWVAAAVLLGQFAFGSLLPHLPRPAGVFALSERFKREDFETRPFEKFLDRQGPNANLVLCVPRDQDWPFAIYNLVAFGRYTPRVATGLVLDNSLTPRNLYPDPHVPTGAGLLLAKRTSDCARAPGLDVPIEETRSLALFAVSSDVAPALAEAERRYRDAEAAKPLHVPNQPQLGATVRAELP